LPVIPDVRLSDLEPYVGLRYLSKLFKLMGVVLGLLLVAEIVTGVVAQGSCGDSHAPRRGEPPDRAGRAAAGASEISRFCSSMSATTCVPRAFLLARQTHAVAPPTPAAARAPEPANGVARPERGDRYDRCS
jgi:hypothetical protein